jgi:hypothetical protein
MLKAAECERARALLEELGARIRDAVLDSRDSMPLEAMSRVAAVTEADTIYQIDKVTEDFILDWLGEHWPEEIGCALVMEGLEDELVLPRGAEPTTKLILDPIDGTRGLMYDKRPAWALAGLAPYRGAKTSLQDIQVAVMTEIPTFKQGIADQLSAIRGSGARGSRRLLAEGVSIPLEAKPSGATGFAHGFASLAKFFPQGKALTAAIEEDLWAELFSGDPEGSPLVFDDQYLSTGGQIYELAMGHDRMIGDIRPLVFRKLGLISSLSCHPYDICTALVLTELGGIVETPGGLPVDAPLDTTSPVAWVGYGNEQLAGLARPALRRALERHLGNRDK